MNLIDVLRGVEVFDGLEEADLEMIASICHQRELAKGDILAEEGELRDDLYIIAEGVVEVLVSDKQAPRVIINLGTGQIIGEMALVDRGPRSATVRAIHTPTVIQVIKHGDFHRLCQQNTQIGYIVMYNIAADLSFKLRHRNLSETSGAIR